MYYNDYVTPFGNYPYDPYFYGPIGFGGYGYGVRQGYNGFWLGLAVVLLILLFLFGGHYFKYD